MFAVTQMEAVSSDFEEHRPLDVPVAAAPQATTTSFSEMSTAAAIEALHDLYTAPPQTWIEHLVNNATANTYLVAGAVVGCALLILIVGTLMCCCWLCCGGRRGRSDSDRGSYQVERAMSSDGIHLKQQRRADEDFDLRYKEADLRASSGGLGIGSGAGKPNGILKKPYGMQPSAAKPFIKNGARPSPRGDARTPLASAGTEWYV